ncbi:MAG TPA: DUF2142 domain-containing protein [Candidatus Aquilonibacter sp.]|nr:DUF2142 domain-containing protein [Candidatus Aquilonibacter sp.]
MSKIVSESRERIVVLLLCLLAGIHVFVFSAAFPFFNNMDELFHFDLVVKYSRGHIPRGLELVSDETMRYGPVYSSPEFLCLPGFFSDDQFPPPPWKYSAMSANENPQGRIDWWWTVVRDSKKSWRNYESSQQPLYYTLAGLWWDVGQWCGIKGLHLLYWLRFLNILFVSTLVWLGYMAARLVFPEIFFVRLGVPAVIAFMPQQAFYSVQNDVLSPVCFAVAFICLIKWLGAERPEVRLGILTGLALAATFLTKMSNAPVLGVSALAVFLKTWRVCRAGKLRAWLPGLAALFFSAALPVSGWLIWSKYAFGDFSGTAAKLQAIGWTVKPFSEWWHHPIFTFNGFWTFLSELLAAFWQGEFCWHANPLDLPIVDAFFVVPSICFTVLAIRALLSRSSNLNLFQRYTLWFGFLCFVAGVGFLAFLSIRFDFGTCPNPSRDHPYFIAGRLLLGALVPFLLFLLYGIHHLLRGAKSQWLELTALAAILLFMLISEIVTDWSVFQSPYNWYHS